MLAKLRWPARLCLAMPDDGGEPVLGVMRAAAAGARRLRIERELATSGGGGRRVPGRGRFRSCPRPAGSPGPAIKGGHIVSTVALASLPERLRNTEVQIVDGPVLSRVSALRWRPRASACPRTPPSSLSLFSWDSADHQRAGCRPGQRQWRLGWVGLPRTGEDWPLIGNFPGLRDRDLGAFMALDGLHGAWARPIQQHNTVSVGGLQAMPP